VAMNFDAVVITDLENTYDSWDVARSRFGESRVLLPRLLGVMKKPESDEQ
jgi:hypothetical protein